MDRNPQRTRNAFVVREYLPVVDGHIAKRIDDYPFSTRSLGVFAELDRMKCRDRRCTYMYREAATHTSNDLSRNRSPFVIGKVCEVIRQARDRAQIATRDQLVYVGFEQLE